VSSDAAHDLDDPVARDGLAALAAEVAPAARALAGAGLVDAFGHISVRQGTTMLITPPRPLATIEDGAELHELALDVLDLPAGVPREAFIHAAIYRARPDVSAICRAQPPSPLAAGVAGVAVRALHGQGAFLGEVMPVFDEARLVRDRARGEALAQALGTAPAIIMRGNGAVTTGTSAGRAMALMYVLECSAALNLRAGEHATPLSDAERAAWQDASQELLHRMWDHLRRRCDE
jgi:ribulose-5-phosphate 4-epimerase/fuculose-1-phosphate aldolase